MMGLTVSVIVGMVLSVIVGVVVGVVLSVIVSVVVGMVLSVIVSVIVGMRLGMAPGTPTVFSISTSAYSTHLSSPINNDIGIIPPGSESDLRQMR